MKFKFKIWLIKDLIDLIQKDGIDLKPPYQRNFIWSPKEQKSLIDSILRGFPLPSFFIYKIDENAYEMVDGQQRSRTLLHFYNGDICSSDKKHINDIDKNTFLNYKLNLALIYDLSPEDSLEEFYALVNRTGQRLNIPELFKAQYHQTKFLQLVEDLVNYQKFIDLDLFAESTKKRMNDRSFVEEIIAYIKHGITDKKEQVERIYKIDITDEEYIILGDKFKEIIDRVTFLNNLHPINKTRYKQKNDFYTLFNFIYEHGFLDDNYLDYCYRLMLILQNDISPSNEDCEPLKNYALNCVSQSNSKKAREERLDFFKKILLNKEMNGNDFIVDIIEYYNNFYKTGLNKLKSIKSYWCIDINELNKILKVF